MRQKIHRKAAFYSFDYISKMVAQYLLFAVILFALGRISQINLSGTVNTRNQVASSEEISDDATDEDDFKDWFQDNDE